ncbi:MAG: shikimate kinase [Candidatus Zixiibacteriota bacterium]
MTRPPTKRHIALVGFSGSGKSTVGPLVAKKLKLKFIDTDQQIERRAGLSVADIFAKRGEPSFRRLERAEVRSACESRKSSVIALGGGALLDPGNQRVVVQNAVVIYLRCSHRELMRRLVSKADRPLLRGARPILESRVRTLMTARLPGYRHADFAISVSTRSTSEIVATILKRIEKYHGTH